MPEVYDYVNGQKIDPVTGKPIKRIKVGTSGNATDLKTPIKAPNDSYMAPGFGNVVDESVEFYEPAATSSGPRQAPPRTPSEPRGGGGAQSGSNMSDRMNDMKGAGAVDSFGDFVRAAMAGATMTGPLGPFKGALAAATGLIDLDDNYGNYNQSPGWNGYYDEGVAEAKKKGITSTAAIGQYAIDYAKGKIEADGNAPPGEDPNEPGFFDDIWDSMFGEEEPRMPDQSNFPGGKAIGDDGSPIDIGGGATVDPAPADKDPGFGGSGSVSIGGKSIGGAGQSLGGGDFDFNGGTKGGGGSDSKGGGGGSMNAGGGGTPTGGSKAGGDMSGARFAEGGYVTKDPYTITDNPKGPQPVRADKTMQTDESMYGMPKSAVQLMRPQQRTQAPGRATGGYVTKPAYNAGGYVEQQEGPAEHQPRPQGAPVAPQQPGGAGMPLDPEAPADGRFNPTPEQIAPDGVIDNQPIMAEEGEYVIPVESSQILGADLLNTLRDPAKAMAFRELFDDVLALVGGGDTGGDQGMPAGPPMPAPSPAGPPMRGAVPQKRGAPPSAAASLMSMR